MDRVQQDAQNINDLLLALVEQSRALATRISGDPQHSSPCHFCDGPLPMWEHLLVLQLAGVPAHVECPPELLEERLAKVGPVDDFPYREFAQAVDRRLRQPPANVAVAGTIDCPTQA